MSEHDACMFRTSSQTLGKIYKSNGIGSGIHTFSQHTKLAGQQRCVISVPIEIFIAAHPHRIYNTQWKHVHTSPDACTSVS
jgi:hypothetical protein